VRWDYFVGITRRRTTEKDPKYVAAKVGFGIRVRQLGLHAHNAMIKVLAQATDWNGILPRSGPSKLARGNMRIICGPWKL